METHCVHIKVKLMIRTDLCSSKKNDQNLNCIMITKCLYLKVDRQDQTILLYQLADHKWNVGVEYTAILSHVHICIKIYILMVK